MNAGPVLYDRACDPSTRVRDPELPLPALRAEQARGQVVCLAFHAVVNFEDLRGAGKLDSNVSQNRHQPFTERLELLPRDPDLADAQVAVRPEADVVIVSRLRRECPEGPHGRPDGVNMALRGGSNMSAGQSPCRSIHRTAGGVDFGL